MSRLEHSASQQQKFFNANHTNSNFVGNPQVVAEFRPLQFQSRNNLKIIDEKNTKLKQDYAINKARLQSSKPNLVQQKRMSSMDNIQIGHQWIPQQHNIQFNHAIQFRKTYQQVVPNFVPPPQQPISPPPNQENRGDFSNINQVSLKTTSTIESLNVQIREYTLKIQHLEKNQQTYINEISDYKERLNKIQEVLHEKESLLIAEKTKTLKQKQNISELERQLLQQKGSQETQIIDTKKCASCDEMSKKITQMTKQITELTNQLNAKTQKLKLVQSSQKTLKSFEIRNKELQAEINKMNMDFEKRTLEYESEVSKLRQKLSSSNSFGIQFESQVHSLREQNLHLKSQLKQTERLTQQRFSELMQENQRLSSQVQLLRRQAQQRNDTSSRMSSSHQQSLYQEYQRSIQLLQEEIYSLRQQIDHRGRSGLVDNEDLSEKNQHIQHLTYENGQLNDRLMELDGERSRLGQELSTIEQRYGLVMEENYSLKQRVQELTVRLQHSQSQNQPSINKFTGQKSQQDYIKQIGNVTHQLSCSKKMIAELFAKIQMLQNTEQDTRTDEQLQVRRYKQTIEKQSHEIQSLNRQIHQIKSSHNTQSITLSLKQEQFRSTQLEQQLHLLRQRIFTLEQQLKQSKQKYEQAYSGLQRAEDHIYEQQKIVNELQNELNILSIPQGNEEHMAAQLNNKLVVIAQMEQEITRLQNQCAFMGNEIQRLNQVMTGLQRNNQLLVKDVKQSQENVIRLNSEVSSVRSQLTIVQRDVNIARTQVSSLKSQRSTLLFRIQQLENRPQQQIVKQVVTDVQQVQRLTQQILTLQRQRDSHATQAHNIKQKLLQAQSFMISISQQLEDKTKEVNILKSQQFSQVNNNNSQELEQLRRVNGELESSIMILRRDNGELNEMLIIKERQLTTVRFEFDREINNLRQSAQLNEKITTLERQLTNKTNEIHQLNSIVSTKERQLAHYRTFEQQILSLQQQLSSKSSQLTHIQSVLSTKQSALTLKQQEISHLRLTQQQLSRNLSLEQSKNLNLQQTQTHLPQTSHNNELNDQLINYQHLIQQLQIQKNTLHQHLTTAENYIYEFEQKNYAQIVDDLHLTINSLEEQRNKLLSRQKQLQNLIHSRQELKDTHKIPQYESRINSYIHQITTLKQRIIIIESEITRLTHLNTELQSQIHTLQQQNAKLHSLEQTIHIRHTEDLQQMKLRIRQLQAERQTFLQNVDQLKNKLLAQQPQTVIQLDQSRVKVDKFIEENHKIIQNLRRAENHIQEMELRCQEYLAEIERLKNGINANVSMRESKRTIINVLNDDQSQFQKTPIKKIDNSSFDHSSGPSGFRENQSQLIRIGELEETILGMRRQIEGRDDYIKNIENKIISLERQRESLQQNVTRLTQAVSTHEFTVREVSAFDNQKREFERLIVQLNHEKAILNSENQRLNELVATKSSEFATVENKWHDIRRNMEEIERRNATLIEQVRIAYQQPKMNESNLQEVQNLRLVISELEGHLRNAERAHAVLTEENRVLSTRILQSETSQQQVHHLRSIISQLESEIQELNRNNNSLIDQFRVLSTQPQQNESYLIEIQKLRQLIGSLEGHIQHLERERAVFISQIQQLETRPQQNHSYLTEINNLRTTIGALENDVHQAKRQNASLIEQIRVITTSQPQHNDVYLLQIQELKRVIGNLETELNNVRRQNSSLAGQLQVTSQKVQQSDAVYIDNQNLKNIIQELEGHLQRLQQQNAQLIDKVIGNESQKQPHPQTQRILQQNQEMRNIITNLQLHIHQLQRQKSQLVNQIQTTSVNAQKQQQTYLRDIANLNSNIMAIQVENEKTKSVLQKENWDLKVLIGDLENKLQKLQKDNSQVADKTKGVNDQKKIEKYIKEINDLKSTVSTLDDHANRLNDQLLRLQEENNNLKTSLQASNQQLSQQLQKIRTLQTIIINLQSAIDGLHQQNDNLKSHIGQIQQINQDLIQRLAESQNKSRSLQQTISSTIVINPSQNNYETQVQMLKNQLIKKQQQIQDVIAHLNNAEAFIASNEAVFLKGQQDKVQMEAKITELTNQLVQLTTINQQLQKDIQERHSPLLIDAENEKSILQLKLVELQRNFSEIIAQNNQLQQQLAIALQVKPSQQHPIQQQQQDSNEIIKNLSQQNISLQQQQQQLSSQIQQWQEQVSNLNSQLKKVQTQHKELLNQNLKQKEDFQRLIDQLNKQKNHNKNLSDIIQKLRLQSKNNQTRFTQFVDQQNALRQQLRAHYMNEFNDLQSQLTNAHQDLSNTRNQLSTVRHKLLTIEINQPAHNNSQQEIQQQRFLHQQAIQRITSQHKEQLNKINDQNRFLQDSIAQLNGLIEKDRKTINELKDQLEQANQRHIEEVIHLRNELEQTISSQQDTDYITQLQGHIKILQNRVAQLEGKIKDDSSKVQGGFKVQGVTELQENIHKLQTQLQHVEQVKDQIYSKLRQAEAYIIYLEQQQQQQQKLINNQGTQEGKGTQSPQQQIQQNQLTQIIQGIPQEVHNEVLQRLVQAQSELMQLQKTLKTPTKVDDNLIKERDNLVAQVQLLTNENKRLASQNINLKERISQLEKQLAQLFKNHDQKLDEMTQRNLRIQEELQLTVIRVSQEHMQLVAQLEKVNNEKKDLQNELSEVNEKLFTKDNTQQQINSRVLEEMRATIARISQENRILIQQNQQIDTLKDQLDNLTKQLNEKTTQVQEFEKALQAQVQQLYQVSTELNQSQQLLNNKETQVAETSENLQKLTKYNHNLIAENESLRAQLLNLSTTRQQQQPSGVAESNNNYSKMADSLNEITNSLKQKSELINSLNASLTNERNKSAQVQKNLGFFQTKLRQAEDYIAQTQEEKKLLTTKYQQLKEELQRLKLLKIEQRPYSQGDNSMNNNSIGNLSAIMDNDQKYRQIKETADNQQSMIRELQMTITELQVELDSKDHQLNEKRKEIQGLKQMIKKLQQEKETLNQNISKLNDIISGLNENITGLNQNVKTLEDKVELITDRNSSLSNNITDLQLIISNLEKELNDQRQVKEQLNNALQQSTITDNTHNQQNQKLILSLENTLQNKDKEIDELKNKIERLEDEKLTIEQSGRQAFSRELQVHKRLNEQLIKANKESNQQLNLLRDKALQATQLKHTLNQTQHKLKDLQNQLKDKDSIHLQLKNSLALIDTLSQDKDLLTKDKESLVEERDALTKDKLELTQQRDTLTEEKSSLLNKIEELIKEKETLESRLNQEQHTWKSKESSLQQELNQNNQMVKALSQEVYNKTQQTNLLKTKLFSDNQFTKTLNSQLEQTQKLVQTYENQVNEEKNKSQIYERTIRDLKAQLDESRVQVDKLKVQVDELKAQVQKQTNGAKQHVRKALQHVKRASQMEVNLKDLSGQLATTQTQLSTTKTELSSTKTDLQSTKSQLSSTKSQLQSSKSQFANLSKELQNTRNQLSQSAPQLTDSLNRIAELQRQLLSVQSQNEGLVEQLVEAESQITKHPMDMKILQDKKNAEIQQLNNTIKGLNDRINDLTQAIANLKQDISQKQNTHKQEIHQKEQEIKRVELIVHQRDKTIKQQQQAINAGQQLNNIKLVYEQQINDNNQRIQTLLNQLHQSQQQVDKLNQQLNNTQQQLNAKLNETNQNQNKLNELNTTINTLNDRITQQNGEISQLIKLHQHLMDQISQEHAKVQLKQSQINQLKKQLNGIDDLKKQLLEKTQQNQLLLNDLNHAKSEIQSYQDEINNFAIFKDKLFEAEKYIKSLEQQTLNLQQQVQFLQDKLSSNEVLKKSVEEKSDLLSSRELEISNMSVDLKEITHKLNDKQQELLESQNELIEIKQKISQMEIKIEEQERAKTALKLQLDSSIENSHQLSLLNDRLTETEKQLLAEKVKNKDLENRNNQLTESLVELQVNNNELNTSINDLQKRNNELLSSLEKMKTQFGTLEQENNNLKDQLKELESRLQTIIEQHSAKQPSQEQQQQVEELRLKLLEKEQQLQPLRDQIVDLNLRLGNYEIDIENYRKIIEQSSKEHDVEQEIQKLKDNLKSADQYITNIDTQYQQLNNDNQRLINQNNTLKLQINQLNQLLAQLKNEAIHDKALISQLQTTVEQLQSTINKLQSSPKSSSQSKIPSTEDQNDKIAKIVQKLTKYVDQNDSLDVFLEQNIQKDLTSNPIFKNLYETIKYKLRLLNAIDKEKTVTLSEKQRASQELITSMKRLEDQKNQMVLKVSQVQILETSYHEVLAKLIEMERLNLSLENQVNQLNNQLSLHKSQIQEFQSKLQNESSSLSAQVSGQGERSEGNINNGGDLFIDEQLKEQNLRLRKQLEEANYELHKLRNNTSNFESFHNSPVISPLMTKRVNENNQFFKEFLRDCLMAIGNLQDSVSGIEKDLIGNRQSIERLLMNKNPEKPALGSKGSEDSWMLEKIQQLEEKLLENEQKLKQHKDQTEMELIGLVRNSVITPLTNEAQSLSAPHFDRERVESYLKDLEEIILSKQIAHEKEINRLKSVSERYQRNDSSISPHKELQNERAFDVDDLLKQIAGLNKHIQFYHAQSDRRKAHYKKTIEELLRQIELLKKQYESIPLSTENKPIPSLLDNIAAKTKSLLDHQSLEDFDQKSDYLNDDDFIVSNNYVQWISKKGGNDESPNKEQEQHFVHDLKSIAEEFQNKESSIPSRNNLSNADNNQNPTSVENRILNLSNNVSKEELLSRPILQFIIQNKEFDEEQVNLLKKKINELQSKTSQQKMKLLKEHEQRVAEALNKHNLLKDPESPHKQAQTQAALNTLCANLTKDQVQKLVSSSNNQQQLPEQMIIRIQQVLSCSSGLQNSSLLKSDSNAYEMMQTILQIKSKHYPEPTPLSEQMFHHLIKLLSSKDNQEFYGLVDSLFSYLAILENDFLITLKQKEEMYQKHTEKMNQVLGLDDSSDEDLDLEDQEYYKKILLLTKDQQAEIQKLRKEETEKGISEQLQEELRKAVDQEQKQ